MKREEEDEVRWEGWPLPMAAALNQLLLMVEGREEMMRQGLAAKRI